MKNFQRDSWTKFVNKIAYKKSDTFNTLLSVSLNYRRGKSTTHHDSLRSFAYDFCGKNLEHSFRIKNPKEGSRVAFLTIEWENERGFPRDRHGPQISQDWNAASQNCLCPQMIKIVYAPRASASHTRIRVIPVAGKIISLSLFRGNFYYNNFENFFKGTNSIYDDTGRGTFLVFHNLRNSKSSSKF